MGQYYRPYLVEEKTGKEIVLNRKIDGKYTLAKIMEHSWWKNSFMNAVCSMIDKNPHKIAWVGDYAGDCEFYEKVWGEHADAIGLHSVDYSLDGKYIVNHTKKVYLDCDAYKERNNNDGWIIHPLSLLTAIGNGGGGGDYYSEIGKDNVGSWYMDVISIENDIPEAYSEVKYDFRE